MYGKRIVLTIQKLGLAEIFALVILAAWADVSDAMPIKPYFDVLLDVCQLVLIRKEQVMGYQIY